MTQSRRAAFTWSGFARWTATALLLQLSLNVAVANAASVLRDDIPPQPLTSALRAFFAQTSLQIVYESDLAIGKYSPGARRGEEEGDALLHLLDGTGLRCERLNERSLRLVAATSPAETARPSRSQLQPPSTVVDDVVVTAQKRPEPRHSVPISAGVLTDATLAEADLVDVDSMMAVIPGVNYETSSQWGSGIYKNLTIRGIRSDKEQATTSIYLDDTPIDMPHSSFTNAYPFAFDLERVEVLRGPQGVFFGQAAEGGAVRFISHPASTRIQEARYHVEFASTQDGGGSLEGSAVAAMPIVPGTFGVRLGAWYRDDGGFVDRVDPFTGARVDANANRDGRRALRIAAVYEPTDSIRLTPTFYYQTLRAHDASSIYPTLSDPGAGVLRSGRLLRQPSDDAFSLASLRAEVAGSSTAFTAIVAYYDRRATAIVDHTNEVGTLIGGYGNPLGPAYPVSAANAISHPLDLSQTQSTLELRLASSGTGPVSWLAGAFLSRVNQLDRSLDYTVDIPTDPALSVENRNRDGEDSIFGNVSYRFLPRWTASAGLRAGQVHGRFWTHTGGYYNAAGEVITSGRDSAANPPVGRVDLSFAATPEIYLYASAANGARRGGGDPSTTVECGGRPTPTSFGEDSLWSFELGVKSEVLGHRLRIDASAYDIQWSNPQVSVYDACGNRYILNASRVVSRGVELDLEALVGEHLRLQLVAGYNDIRLQRDVYGTSGELLAHAGAVNGGLPIVPSPWQGSLFATYRLALTDRVDAYLRGELTMHSHNPGPFAELDHDSPFYNPSVTADPATTVANMRVGVRYRAVDVAAFVTNAFNSQPRLQLNNDAPGSTLVYGYSFRPRTLGLSATVQY